MNFVPHIYTGMIAVAAGTIGAIAGLSHTSVSNTLLESLIVLATGSAGIFIAFKKENHAARQALQYIGLSGLIFFATFWSGYALAKTYQSSMSDHVNWDKTHSVEQNIVVAEIVNHARNLGYSGADLARIRERALELGTSSTLQCPMRDEFDSVFLAELKFVFTKLSDCNLTGHQKHVAEYIEKVSEQLGRNLPDAKDTPAERSERTARYHALIRFIVASAGTLGDVGRPHDALAKLLAAKNSCLDLVGGSTAGGELASFALSIQKKVQACRDDEQRAMLDTFRSHGGAFADIWGLPARPDVTPGFTFEGN